MRYHDLEPISKQLTIVVGLTVVGFMAFGLALSFYRSILFEGTLHGIDLENKQLREKITEGYRDLDYYRSAQYKDKVAKESLNRVNPGEQVLIIVPKPTVAVTATGDRLSSAEAAQAAYEELLQQMPVFDHWKLYLFNRDKLEELRRSL